MGIGEKLSHPLTLRISFSFVKFNSILRLQEFSSKVVAQLSSTLIFATSRHHKDLEQESQRRAREVDALEQRLAKAAADTWPKFGNIRCADRMVKTFLSRTESEFCS